VYSYCKTACITILPGYWRRLGEDRRKMKKSVPITIRFQNKTLHLPSPQVTSAAPEDTLQKPPQKVPQSEVSKHKAKFTYTYVYYVHTYNIYIYIYICIINMYIYIYIIKIIMIIISVVVRPHQVLHHQASHLVVHEVPRQLIFARSLSKSSYSSSWELKAELKHVWVNALANSQLPALPL